MLSPASLDSTCKGCWTCVSAFARVCHASNSLLSAAPVSHRAGAAHVVRFSTDTGSSSSAVRSWTSSSTSSAAAASSSSMSAHPAHPAQPRHAAAAGGAAVTPPRPAARVQHAATAPAPHVDRPSAAVAAAGPMGRAASDPSADVGLVLQASVAPRGGVHFMSGGPQQDQHWDFGRFGGKDVRVLLQVCQRGTKCERAWQVAAFQAAWPTLALCLCFDAQTQVPPHSHPFLLPRPVALFCPCPHRSTARTQSTL